MPWQERCAMDQRRLFVGEYLTGLWTMTQLCEQFGISRKTGYKWLGRYDTGGRPALADQSRRPQGHPAATSDRVVQRLLETRARFPRWSMGKVVTWLRRRYPRTAWPCRTTAYDLMQRAGVARAPKRRGPPGGRPSAPGRALTDPTDANTVWTTDFKGKFLLGDATYCHPFTLRDGFSRFVLRCDGVPAESYPCTRPLFERAFAEFGLPTCIRSDNGTPFASTGLAGLSRLSVWWMQLGIRVERIAPGCPEQNGSHEQFHRVLKRDTTRPPGPTAAAQQRRFDAFRHEYNEERPHDALAGASPASLYTRSPRRLPRRLPAVDYPSYWEVRGADSSGVITFHGQPLNVTRALANQDIGLEEIDDALWRAWFLTTPLGDFDERRWRWVRPRHME
jgi:transposase InsO family protein